MIPKYHLTPGLSNLIFTVSKNLLTLIAFSDHYHAFLTILTLVLLFVYQKKAKSTSHILSTHFMPLVFFYTPPPPSKKILKKKRSENLWFSERFSGVFRGYRKKPVV